MRFFLSLPASVPLLACMPQIRLRDKSVTLLQYTMLDRSRNSQHLDMLQILCTQQPHSHITTGKQ